MQLTNLLLVGLLLGMRHALEPDHLASVATISTPTSALKATSTRTRAVSRCGSRPSDSARGMARSAPALAG